MIDKLNHSGRDDTRVMISGLGFSSSESSNKLISHRRVSAGYRQIIMMMISTRLNSLLANCNLGIGHHGPQRGSAFDSATRQPSPLTEVPGSSWGAMINPTKEFFTLVCWFREKSAYVEASSGQSLIIVCAAPVLRIVS